MADAVLSTKIAVLVLFFVVTMLCGLLPMLLARLARSWTQRFKSGRTGEVMSALSRHGDLVVSCIMCLGAGVLLATIFTHMIPEAREVFAEIEAAGLFPDIGVPPGELFLCAGFFLVYFIEEAAHAFMARGRRRKHKRAATHAAAEAGEKAADSSVDEWRKDSSVDSEESTEECPHCHAVKSAHAGHDHLADLATAGQHAFRAYLIVIALSVHSVFEGFAAAFEDTTQQVWIFFAAIMAHKAIVAFCIGEQLLNTKRSTCFVVSNLIIFSLATPLGVLLGLVVASPSQQGGGTLLATGILQGLAAGTILYVIFFELLGPEQHKPGPGLLKFFAMVLGFVLMLIIHSTGGHSHSHGGHSHAVGAHGHGPHDHAGVHHGHDHGAHGDDHDHVVRRVENAIHAHDHDDHDHSNPHDHHDHSNDNQRNVDQDVHGHDHDHDHDHGHKNAVPPKTVKVLDDHSNHDHDHSNHNHDLPKHDHDHSSHDHHNHSDHDHSTDRSHIDHSSEAANGPGGDNGTLYEIIDSHEETKDSVNVRPVSLPGQSLTAAEKSGNEDEKHHFHADGHDHLGSESSKTASHEHHDHGDHADHDHSDHGATNTDHNHSDHAPHEHMDQDRINGTDHSAHDHTDHGAHDHSDHSGHDHGAHDHTDHGAHEHADNQHPGPTSEVTDLDTSADLNVTSADLNVTSSHGAAEEFKDLKTRTSTLPDSDGMQANRTEVNSR